MVVNNHIQKVAIVGAGGQLGKHITDALLQKGIFRITALSREESTYQPPEGVSLARINYDKSETVVEALRGHDALVMTMAINALGHTETVIKAAAEAEVPWILPNDWVLDGANEQLGKDTWAGPLKKKDRDLIESLGKSKWINVTCSFWYEYSLCGPDMYGIDIEKRKVTWFDNGDVKIHTSTWAQTGRAVAGLLSLPVYPEAGNSGSTTISSYANYYVYITSFTVSQRDIFKSLKRVTGTTDADWSFEMVSTKERFEKHSKALQANWNRFDFTYVFYTRIFFPDGAGSYSGKALDNEKLGLPQEDLDACTKEAVEMANRGYMRELFPELYPSS